MRKSSMLLLSIAVALCLPTQRLQAQCTQNWVVVNSTTLEQPTGCSGIGINMNTAPRPLSVTGSIGWYASNGNSLGALSSTGTDSGQLNLFSGGNSMAFFTTSGNSYLLGGNLGIGTNTPGEMLHVFGGNILLDNNGGNNGFLKAKDSAGTVRTLLGLSSGNVTILNAGGAGGTMAFQVGGSTKMLMDNNGNLGIGTSTPSALLNVVKAAAPTSVSLANSYLHLGRGELGLNSYRLISFGYVQSNANPPAYIGYQEMDLGNATAGDLVFGARSVNTDTAPSEILRIKRNGTIGIDTPVPVATLHLAKATAPPSISVANSYLHLGQSEYGAGSYRAITFGFVGGAQNPPAYIGYQEASTAGYTNGDLVFGGRSVTTDTAPSEYMRINANGNVTVGTTSAPGNLAVTGSSSVSGNASVTGNLTVNGTITGTALNPVYQDIAEWVPESEHLAPGTVVVIDPANRNEVRASSKAYDTTVAGVVSAAPGVILGRAATGHAKVATLGRVRVHVDATSHPIHLGDLLVTSDKPGTAMVSEPIDVGGAKFHRPGTLIGKALEPLASGEGDVLVLLSLQ